MDNGIAELRKVEYRHLTFLRKDGDNYGSNFNTNYIVISKAVILF